MEMRGNLVRVYVLISRGEVDAVQMAAASRKISEAVAILEEKVSARIQEEKVHG